MKDGTPTADGDRRPASARGRRIVELTAYRNALDHALLTELHAFDRAAEWQADDATSCAAWLSCHAGMNLKTAYENLRVARALGELPHMRAAMRRGRLSYTQARALTRIATPRTEQTLLELAASTSGQQLEHEVKFIRARAAADTGEIDPANLRMWSEELDDGAVLVHTGLRPDQAAMLRDGLEVMKRLAQPKQPGSVKSIDALMLMVNLAIAAATRHLAARSAAGDDEKQRRQETTIGRKFEGLLIVSATALQERIRPPLDPCELSDGTQLSIEAARRLSCDASLRALLVDDDGTPLDIGRRTARISPALRAAVIKRDRHCTFPGCTSRLGLDVHHIEHWADGGETKESNLTLQCRAHHVIVHEGGYTMARTARGRLEVHDRDGRLVPQGPSVPDVPAKPSPSVARTIDDPLLQAAIATATREALARARGA